MNSPRPSNRMQKASGKRTYNTYLVETKGSVPVSEIGQARSRVYRRRDLFIKRRKMIQTWADYLREVEVGCDKWSYQR